MSYNGVIGLKKAELETKVSLLMEMSANIEACAANAGISLSGGVANSSFVISKGSTADSMRNISLELGTAGKTAKALVDATVKYLNGVKASITAADK